MSKYALLFVGLLALAGVANAAALFDGKLQVMPVKGPVDRGTTLAVTLSFSPKTDAARDQRTITERQAQFYLYPYRFSLYNPAPVPVLAAKKAPGQYELSVPATVNPDWYMLIATVTPQPGEAFNHDATDDVAAPPIDLDQKNPLACYQVIGIRDAAGAPAVRVSTERARCVFCPGEQLRLYVTARGKAGVQGAVQVKLTPRGDRATAPLLVAQGTLNSAAGKEQVVAFDLPAKLTSAIAPGRYDLTVLLNNQVMDNYPVAFVAAGLQGAGARWWHGLPFGLGSGFSADSVTPGWLEKNAGWVDKEALAVHNANYWVNMFAGSLPLMGPAQDLPGADAADMPPSSGVYCPSGTFALYQLLMARGISLGVMQGYTEAGSENYMPLPTVFKEQMDVIARKYLMGSLSLAQFPHFTGVYTDAYAKPDWHNNGELSDAQFKAVTETLFRRACEYAGIPAELPYQFGDDKQPIKRDQASTSPNITPAGVKAFEDYVAKVQKEQYGNDPQLLAKQTQAVKLKIWNEAWAAGGINTPPVPRLGSPQFPKPNNLDTTKNPMAYYKYTEYVQRGLERCYTNITHTVESELPAVFTMQNRNRENHWAMPYSWEWSRSPSVPPEYSHGCTVIACSEWNLDAEPQPYLTTAEVNRTLLDEGRPVWRTASFHFNGSQSRFLRDAIFLTGRGMTPFYATPESATWSHKGADQSTYAAKDRLDTVTQFLTTYEGLFDTLQPVREVAYYVHPGWGDPNSQNMVVGLPAALMTGYQVHAISHADLQSGALAKYKIVLAPGLTGPFNYPFEPAAFKDFTAKGGSIVGTVTGTRYYAEFQDPTKFGIKVEDQPVLNRDGTPSIDRNTGKPVTKRVFVETLEQRAQLAAATVWGDMPRTSVLPLDLGDQWAYKDAEGKKVSYSSRAHWTGYQLWANAKAPAVESAPTLKAAFDKVSEPLVIKDQPQVFVCAERPRDAKAQGLFLFVSNYTIPDDPRWTSPRVPYFFWPTYAKPNVTTIKVKEEGIGAIYDLMTGRPVPFTREGGRVVFSANLGTIEGRVFACYPAPISGASLTFPASAAPGSKLVGTFRLLAAGTPVPYQASVWIKVQDADGLVLRNIYRSLPAEGTLPEIEIPADARGPLSVIITDTVSGRTAQASVAIAAPALMVATEANPITIYRGDAIHRILTDKAPIRIMVTEGKDDFGTRDKKPYREIKPENINAGVANERRWAESLRLALQNAGLKAEVVSSNVAVVGPLAAHPWEGNGAWVRESGTVPNRRVEGPVIILGSVKTNTYLQDLERSCVAPRAFGQANTGAGRAVIAYLPRAFSPEADSIAVVGDDDAGMAEAARQLARLVATDPGPDSYYTAREHIRYQWLPADVARFKTQQGIPDPGGAPGTATANAAPAVPAKDNGWEGVENRLGPHIFTLDASANGVAVGLSSLAKPLALVSAEGKPVFFAGGNADVMPRDVAVSADGKTAIAGYSLSGKVIAYTADGKPSWEEKAAIFTKPDPLNWDTYKDSERFLTVSPDHTMVIAAAGTRGFVAREANTGKVLWTLAADQDPGWPNGIQSSQISWSPDGRYAMLYSDSVNTAKELTIQDVLVDVTTGQRVWTGPRDASDWELYSTVGAQGAWTITSGRGTTFAFRDDKGAVLRIFKAEQLPAELAVSRGMIPPLFLAGLPVDRLVMTRAETQALYVMDVLLGSEAQRAAARQALAENDANATKLITELQDKRSTNRFSNEYVDAFMKTITAPEEAKRMIAAKMKRFPLESAAGRGRNYNWIAGDVDLFKQLQFAEDRAIIEAAADLKPRRNITLPAIICDAKVDMALKTAYVGLWDGTVRAYDLETGTERWRAAVEGGCQLAVTGNALYAGGSRGDLYRIDTDTGKLRWKVNLTAGASGVQ